MQENCNDVNTKNIANGSYDAFVSNTSILKNAYLQFTNNGN
jgi:hypothetical protein